MDSVGFHRFLWRFSHFSVHLAEALEEWHSAVQVATAKACESAALSSPGADESRGDTEGLDVYRT